MQPRPRTDLYVYYLVFYPEAYSSETLDKQVTTNEMDRSSILFKGLLENRLLTNVATVRGNHLSDTTCLTQVLFKSGEGSGRL